MERLTRATLEKRVKEKVEDYPCKVVQFGEGNFLRGFVDWMINRMNESGLFCGKVVVVQPIKSGLVDELNKQDGLYTLILRGIHNGEIVNNTEIITSVSHGINLYENYDKYLELARNPDLKVIVSNTTEAGIAYNENDNFDDRPPSSFPAKLLLFLYNRFKAFNGDKNMGFYIFPCELIDRNGDKLKEILLQYIEKWSLGENFKKWVCECNHFYNTLVDRIVTGYPEKEMEKLTEELGYVDRLVDTGEVFHLWVIECHKNILNVLPFDKLDLNVILTNDLTPYRDRKVRILNGAHTMTVLAAYLYGKDTVKECVDDELVNLYMRKGIFEEIIPTLDLPKEDLIDFANSVLERFANPFIQHYLLSISLNSVSKFRTRVLPSILEYAKRKGRIPQVMSFSFAALMAFYRGERLKNDCLVGYRKGIEYEIRDDVNNLVMFKELWDGFDGTRKSVERIVKTVFSKKALWDMDLNEVEGLADLVAGFLFDIVTSGIENTMKGLVYG